MNSIMIKAVSTYQCPGCMRGTEAESCESADIRATGCEAQSSGTLGSGIGNFAMGLPRGFNRFGNSPERKFAIHPSYEDMIQKAPNFLTIFNIPAWKHLDEHGNTIVRWFSPRINYGYSTVTLGDCREKFPNAVEITAEMIEDMD